MLNKKDIARRVKNELSDVTLRDIELIMEVGFEQIVKAVVDGEGVRIVNFGAIEPSKRAAHLGTNPADPNGPKIQVPEVRTVRFRPCTSWRESMNGKDAE